MKALQSNLFDELSGKLGRTVLRRVNNSITVSNYKKNKALTTAPAYDVKFAFNYLTTVWSNLSASGKAAFEAVRATYTFYDRFNNSFHPSAYQLFVHLNMNVQLFGQPLITAPIAFAIRPLPSYDAPGVIYDESPWNITCLDTLDATEIYLVYMSAPMRVTPYPTIKQFKLILAYQFTLNESYDIFADYVARYGVPGLDYAQCYIYIARFDYTTGHISEFNSSSLNFSFS